MSNDWLQKLKAGDKVLYCYSYDLKKYSFIATVEQITSTGFIKVNGFLFSPKTGYTEDNENRWIEEATEQVVTETCKKEIVQYALSRLGEIYNIAREQIIELNKLLDGWGEDE